MVVGHLNCMPYAHSTYAICQINSFFNRNSVSFSFLEFSGTNPKDKKLFKVICTDACKDINIRLDAADGDLDLCARYYQIVLYTISSFLPSVYFLFNFH